MGHSSCKDCYSTDVCALILSEISSEVSYTRNTSHNCPNCSDTVSILHILLEEHQRDSGLKFYQRVNTTKPSGVVHTLIL